MADIYSAAAQALKGRVVAVMNTSSGGWDAAAADQTHAIFHGAGLPDAQIVLADPSQIEAALASAIASADVVVVLGGDGTIRTAAEQCGAAGRLILPLPGGTMNMLPKALYGQRLWREALTDTLADPLIHDVSGGKAGEHAFFVAALLGAPTLWAEAREAIRAAHPIEAAKRAMAAARRSFSEPLAYQFGDTLRGSAEAVAVVCPLISKVMREDERSLEAAARDPVTAGEAVRLGIHALFDDWRDDPKVSRAKVKRVSVEARGRVPVILDGERVRMSRRVVIDFVPVAFRALVPAGFEAAPPQPVG
jgi:diacylglycerol kinase family enzyme